MSQLTVPIIATVIGEGGSGGALALGVADRVLMMENAVYSVISVEGCAAILWKDAKSPEMREKAATALKITAPELLELKVIDEVVPEPKAARTPITRRAAKALQEVIDKHLEELRKMRPGKTGTAPAPEFPPPRRVDRVRHAPSRRSRLQGQP